MGNKYQNNQIFELYKPLRNHLRQVSLQESLYVLWAYIQYLQFDKLLPSDITGVPPEILLAENKIGKRFYEWELEVLIREVIINSQEGDFGTESLRKWNYFSGAVNKLKELEDEIDKKFIDKTNVLLELHRIGHRQFPWQSKPNREYITRYFKIFGCSSLDTIIQNVIGLSTQELYLNLMILFSFYQNKLALLYPIKIEGIPEINQETLNKALDRFSCDLTNLKNRLIKEQEINERFVYSYSSLRAYPIIAIKYNGKDSLICPAPTLLVWRFTSGIFYEICKEKGFGNEFGKSFQSYTGEVIGAGNNKVSVYPEKNYYDGKHRKDTVDWIMDENKSALFIECKAKRISAIAKAEIKSEEELKKELDIMADFVVQLYKSIRDYLDNKYPTFKHKKERKIFPLIVTLEDWYLYGDKLLDELKNKVKEKFKVVGLPLTFLLEMPYSVCSIQDFEMMVQVMEKVGIKLFMEKKVFDEYKEKWSFFPFITSVFPNEKKDIKFLFPDDFDKIFPKRFFEEGILNRRE